MGTLQLSPETVNAYREILTNPAKHGLNFPPLEDCFHKSDTVTAKHELAKQYSDFIDRDIPKILFYIIMDEIYAGQIGKDENGNLGYYLQIKKQGSPRAGLPL